MQEHPVHRSLFLDNSWSLNQVINHKIEVERGLFGKLLTGDEMNMAQLWVISIEISIDSLDLVDIPGAEGPSRLVQPLLPSCHQQGANRL